MMIMFITTVLLLVSVTVDGCPVVSFVNESCCEVKGNGFKFSTSIKSRVFNITNFCGDCELIAEGYCDTVTAGGGWLVIQRRQDGSVDFNRDWVDYEDGFGSLTGEFWYGLRAIQCLTNQGQWELRIDYTFTNGTKGYLSYSNFRVGPATKQYPLNISGFDRVTNDPFYTTTSNPSWSLNGWKFTTRDRDNDRWSNNCAVQNNGGNGGGWWYNHCSALYLNHQYNHKNKIHLNGKWHPLPFTEIKIRPKDCII
ncbi:fibrinogen-like protein 1 [Dysidea avara]|uniref:fibrinogen-like protein 1 n=1 Tax=Dysidea avara TaxID=196820 RepID=UPI00332EC430